MCCSCKMRNIWVIFTSPTWNSIAMFLGVGGLEKGLINATEWNVHHAVFAAVQVKRKGATVFEKHKMCWLVSGSISICQHTFTPSVPSINCYYPLISTVSQKHSHRFFKSLFKLFGFQNLSFTKTIGLIFISQNFRHTYRHETYMKTDTWSSLCL